MKYQLFLSKMKHQMSAGVLEYTLGEIEMKPLIGQGLSVNFTGKIKCINCERAIKKTFNQGHCFPCSQKLAACDLCILKPELCHFRQGTCREPEWAKENCLRDHLVYLANTTGLKIGITRAHKKMERWGDQGAVAALELAIVSERYFAGLLEVELKKHLNDKADWRGLIKGSAHEVDLISERRRVVSLIPAEFQQKIVDFKQYSQPHLFNYPVLKYPEKAVTVNPEKSPQVSGVFQGIRGQYLLIGDKALNVRTYAGYQVDLSLVG